VLKAVTTQKMLAMEYKSAWGKEAKKDKQRTIHPYHIVNLSGTWYLIGSRSEDDMSFRQYAISGISKARVLEKRADIPADFDVEEILDVTFGRFLGDPRQVVSVKVRLSQRVAPLVEGRVFSKKQELRTLPSGDIELSFPASTAGPWPLFHVKGWVLSWGADCEVLEPAELRELVRKDLDAMRDTIARSGDRQRCRN
jgi:proteasome accessory factor B